MNYTPESRQIKEKTALGLQLKLLEPTTDFKTASGCNRLQSLWICVLGRKGSQRASARFRALSTSGLAHTLFARSRYKISFETSCSVLELLPSIPMESMSELFLIAFDLTRSEVAAKMHGKGILQIDP